MIENLTNHYYDHLGSIIASETFNELGVKISQESFIYDTWGNVLQGNKSKASFTGKKMDATGLYYFNARYYDPKLRQFLTEDSNKSGESWYSYCSNDPVNKIDPDGREEEFIDQIMIHLWASADSATMGLGKIFIDLQHGEGTYDRFVAKNSERIDVVNKVNTVLAVGSLAKLGVSGGIKLFNSKAIMAIRQEFAVMNLARRASSAGIEFSGAPNAIGPSSTRVTLEEMRGWSAYCADKGLKGVVLFGSRVYGWRNPLKSNFAEVPHVSFSKEVPDVDFHFIGDFQDQMRGIAGDYKSFLPSKLNFEHGAAVQLGDKVTKWHRNIVIVDLPLVTNEGASIRRMMINNMKEGVNSKSSYQQILDAVASEALVIYPMKK